MARPREFDEDMVLDAAVQCFWSQGYEATSIRDLVEKTGLTCASLYNAFGGKRAIYQRALDHYVEAGVGARIRRCEVMEPREAIGAFFNEILTRSLDDLDHKGCMLVNAALDVAPKDPEFQGIVDGMLCRIEAFFLRCTSRGQAAGTISDVLSAEDLARHLLSTLLGVRVLARVRPDRSLLAGAISSALALLDTGVKRPSGQT